MSDKKAKNEQQIRQKEKKARQKAEEQKQQHKKMMMPLVRFLKKNGIQFRHAAAGNTRIQYFRVDDYDKLLEEKKEQIEKDPILSQIVKKYNDQFVYFKRPQGSKNLKYPKSLEPVRQKNKFASFRFDTTQSRKTYVIAAVTGILLIVLFPIWPFEVKYAIWLICLCLLIFLVSLIVLRLVIYILCSSMGISMWIFPNLLGDYGVIDSFKPFYYIEKWEISKLNILFRLTSFAVIAYFGFMIYIDPTYFSGYFQSTKSTVTDIHDWGVGKIKGQRQNFSGRALTNLQEILNETADVVGYSDQVFNNDNEAQPQIDETI